jgi:hypothetical protein
MSEAAHERRPSEKHAAQKAKPVERRFVPEPTGRSNTIALVGGVAALAFGAGAYGQWVHDTPLESAPVLLAVGALGIVLAAVLGDPGGAPIRVGKAGVAVERGRQQPDRIPWWEVERVILDPNGSIVVEGPQGRRISAAVAHHAAAAAWILKEALDRIPKRVAIQPDLQPALLRDTLEGGALVPAEPVQTAGRRCKASNLLISFEDDARLCEQCGQVYHRTRAPERCMTCDAKL